MAHTPLQDKSFPESGNLRTPTGKNRPVLEKTPLQLISQGICFPSIPLFSTYDKQRAWLLPHMAGAFRVFARNDLAEGMSGHISVRGPEYSHLLWTNPLSVHFAIPKASDMVLLDYEGKIVGGNTAGSDPETLYWEFQPYLAYERELSNGSFEDA